MNNIEKIKSLFNKEEKSNKAELSQTEFKALVEELATKRFEELKASIANEEVIKNNSKPVDNDVTEEKEDALIKYIIDLGDK